jgi:hypothetical protein
MSSKVKFSRAVNNDDRVTNIKRRKRIVDKINKTENYANIYEIGEILANDKNVKNDKSSYTINNNGFHIRVSKLSDETIMKLDDYFSNKCKKINNIDIEEIHKGSIFNYLTENSTDEPNVRLSSKEKKFFKKIQTNVA